MKFAWLISKKIARPAALLAVVLAFLVHTGCATLTRIEDGDLKRTAVSALPADRAAYLFLDVSSFPSTLEQVVFLLDGGSAGLAEIVDNLDYLYAATEVNPETAAWTVIGTGRFPVSTYTLALDFDRGWKRVPGSGRLWISSDGMEIALPGPQMVVIGSEGTDMVAARLSGKDVPEGASGNSFFEALLEEPHPGVVAYLLELGGLLPLEMPAGMIGGSTVSVFGDFSDEGLTAEVIFNFHSPAKARVAGLVIRTISLADSRNEEGGMFAGARVTVDGETVTVSPVVIESSRILEYLDVLITKGGENR